MHVPTLLLTLATLTAPSVLASPHPFAHPAAVAIPQSAPSDTPSSNNGTQPRKGGHKNRHKEHTPVFRTPCECVKPMMPMGILSEKEQCYFRYYQDVSCFKVNPGCPEPVSKC
ncbi:hypothetical protein DM02DRAFT_613362 [Periconia macrospinosa]|uniref:Uncharacterized protein n=1 Tax=Periconia macrospinosa TaxID=97972 RepID=A0A2V1DY83_9PLEO|nr:hypothetical protein DM02DRAFT_613362 [Periconia macrospinosa]